MKIVSFGAPGREKPGLLDGGRIVDLCALMPTLPGTVRAILDADLLGEIDARRHEIDALPPQSIHSADAVRLGPPVTNPSKIICIGMNYRDHAREQNKEVPDWPLMFAKAPSALAGNGDAIAIPEGVTQVDHEVELAIVIGKRARGVALDDAPHHIAGYSVFMDISARDVQFREKQWFRGKSFDGFGPSGPCLVTSDEVADPQHLAISLDVNGVTRQSSNTSEMTFKVFYLVHYLSHSMTLEPGDIIATGTPAGVGVFADPPRFLQKGDVVRATIERLGTLTNPVV